MTWARNKYTFRMHSDNGRAYLNDGVNDAFTDNVKTWWDSPKQTLRLAARWGIDDVNVRKHSVGVRKPDLSGWLHSSEADYSGNFGTLHELILAYTDTKDSAAFKNIQFFNRVLTDAEIERL
jgi:hypothetical protein